MCLHAMTEMLWWILNLVNTWGRWFFNQWDRQHRRKNLSRSWTYDLWLLVQMFQIISLTVIFLCCTFFQKHKVFAFVRNGLSNNILQETCFLMIIIELNLARLISLLFLSILWFIYCFKFWLSYTSNQYFLIICSIKHWKSKRKKMQTRIYQL